MEHMGQPRQNSFGTCGTRNNRIRSALNNQHIPLITGVERNSYPVDGKASLIVPTFNRHKELIAVSQRSVVISGKRCDGMPINCFSDKFLKLPNFAASLSDQLVVLVFRCLPVFWPNTHVSMPREVWL